MTFPSETTRINSQHFLPRLSSTIQCTTPGFVLNLHNDLSASLMYKLNLPEFDFRVKKAQDKVWIFDEVRKKYVVLTPEEWVRQHFVHYIMTEKKIPKSLIRIEGGLLYNQLQKRSDVVVYDRQGQPWMIIECKAPTVRISPATLAQVAVYNSSIRAAYVCITNGLLHLCAHINWEDRSTTQLPELPSFPVREC